ncbi:protein spaetzle-like [Eriocheir sinensis]|uniref:protein spaetzle-like n=1 Tax=Eriocheir sinensis TaxID=95602 RepID=UPI0021C73B38|nr:protein spaetzle-like [Eriocheir sinensis]
MAVTVLALVSLLVPALLASPSVYFPPDVNKSPGPYPLKPTDHPRPSFKSYTLVPTPPTRPAHTPKNKPHPGLRKPASPPPRHAHRPLSRKHASTRRPTPSPIPTLPPQAPRHAPPTYYLHGVYSSYPAHISLPRSSARPGFPTHIVYSLVPPEHQDLSYITYERTVPACAANTTKPWCLEDAEYPLNEIRHAAEYHYEKLLSLYADVADLNTELSAERPDTLDEETYLCPSATAYVRPLRAVNTEGKWRVIVNGIKVHYETLTQTTRLEECLKEGYACPLVPECYESKCLQKSIYHRFLVFDPDDEHFPFVVDTFRVPASCACLLGA